MKISQEQQKEGEKLIHKLITRAWESVTFKEQLISNPKSTIEKLVGKKMTVPKGKKLIVEDQTNPDIIYLNIPAKIEISDFELSDEQLERVSGGGVCGGACIFGVIVAGAQVLDWIGQGWNME